MKIEVTEEKINQAIAIYRQMNDGEDPVAMMAALDRGDIFREAGLTPTYIVDDETGRIVATSVENLDGRIH